MSKKKELKARIFDLQELLDKKQKYIEALEKEANQVVRFAYSSSVDEEDGFLLVDASDVSRLECVLDQKGEA